MMNDVKSLNELVEQLKAEGIPPDTYHIYIDRFLSFKAREQGIPYSGTFELTPLCNLDCKMCYVHLTAEQLNGKKLLTVDQWKNMMTQARDAGMMKARLTGGECLTYPGFDELYLHLHSMGINVAVLTNGVLLNKERIAFFKKHPPNGIQVTLYGSNEETYEKVTGKRLFNTVYSNLREAIKAELPVSLAITPNRFMIGDAMMLVDTAQKLGVYYTINTSLFEPRKETGRAAEKIDASLDTYIEMYKRQLSYLREDQPVPIKEEDLPMSGKGDMAQKGIRCAAGRGMFEIDWQGRLYGCSSLRALYAEPFKSSFAEAWKFIHEKAINYPVPSECANCAYSSVCVTCPAAHEQNGSSAHCNPFYCDRVKKMVMEGIIKLS